jgi:hypothetical protein
MSDLEAEIARLIAKYGLKAVKAAVAKRSLKRGRPKIKIHPQDMEVLASTDAEAWASGRKLQSARAAAEDYAAVFPGHSETGTQDRVRKQFSVDRLPRALRYVLNPTNALCIVQDTALSFHHIKNKARKLGVELSPSADEEALAACLIECARRELEKILSN